MLFVPKLALMLTYLFFVRLAFLYKNQFEQKLRFLLTNILA